MKSFGLVPRGRPPAQYPPAAVREYRPVETIDELTRRCRPRIQVIDGHVYRVWDARDVLRATG
jgi:hypothetical protein